jgi:hypothetical protein
VFEPAVRGPRSPPASEPSLFDRDAARPARVPIFPVFLLYPNFQFRWEKYFPFFSPLPTFSIVRKMSSLYLTTSRTGLLFARDQGPRVDDTLRNTNNRPLPESRRIRFFSLVALGLLSSQGTARKHNNRQLGRASSPNTGRFPLCSTKTIFLGTSADPGATKLEAGLSLRICPLLSAQLNAQLRDESREIAQEDRPLFHRARPLRPYRPGARSQSPASKTEISPARLISPFDRLCASHATQSSDQLRSPNEERFGGPQGTNVALWLGMKARRLLI